jgi:hypothetical protein
VLLIDTPGDDRAPAPVQLSDGSIYVVYMANGGHRPEHMRSQKIFAIRFRMEPDCSGIELLPAPGSPADSSPAR